MRGKLLVALGGSLLMGIAGVARADAPDDSLRAEMEALKSRLAELEAKESSDWLNERRSEEIKSLVHDVLSDADTRASLLENGATAGHNGEHFYLASEDGSFLLQIRGYIQFRNTFRNQDVGSDDDDEGDFPDGPTSGKAEGLRVGEVGVEDENEHGFSIPRAKLIFFGHINDPRLEYLISINVDDENNNLDADEITISYQVSDNLKVWGGEKKAPFLREEIMEPTHVQGADRSYVNEFFTVGIVQGVGIVWTANENVTVNVAITDGQNSGDVGGGPPNLFTQAFGSQGPADKETGDLLEPDDDEFTGCTGDVLDPDDPDPDSPIGVDCSKSVSKDFDEDRTDFAITARVDWKISGQWSQWEDHTAWEGEEQAFFIGAAVHYEVGETGDSAFNNDFIAWTVDGSFENNGFNLYAAIIGLHPQLEDDKEQFADDYDLYGVIVQAGYQIPNTKWEPFVRWEYIDLDDAINDGFNTYDDLNLLTFGVNHYFNGHAARFTFDVVYALDAVPLDSQGLGIAADHPDDEDQVVVRAQMQLMF